MSSIASTTLSSGAGLDVGATVDQLMYAERAPERLWQKQQQMLNAQAAALRDLNTRLETLENRVNTLKDFSGPLGARTVVTSNTALSATADASAELGTHTITVSRLATISSIYSDSLASGDANFGPGELQFSIGGGAAQAIALDETHSTLRSAADYINSLNLGISASVVTDANGARMAIVSKSSGAAGDLAVLSSPAGLGMHVGVAGKNAQLTVDGVPIESATNKVGGVLGGISLELHGLAADVSVNVQPDTGRAQQVIQSFISAYNDLISQINSQFTYNSATGSAGILAGDSGLRDLQSQLLGQLSFRLDGNQDFTTLRSLGLEMQNDGTLQVNATTLSSALQQHPESVQAFFQGESGDGFAVHFSADLQRHTDSVDGSLVLEAKGLEDSSKSITEQISDFEVRMEMREQQLLAEYSRIDAMLRQLPLLQSQLTAQLGSLESK